MRTATRARTKTVTKDVQGEPDAARACLMAITMTLHNLPEGFAVAFSSFTSVGPIMAAAIGVHNVPEGIIVAAPVYAATGSRRSALWRWPPRRGSRNPRARCSRCASSSRT